MSQDRIIDRCKKLLAKAEDPACTEAEREALMEKAQALMLEHAIDEARLAVEQGAERSHPGVHFVKLAKRDEVRTAKATLMTTIAEHNRCRCLLGDSGLYVLGFESDAEYCELLWTSLLVQMANERTGAWKRYNGSLSRFKWLQGYAAGFAHAIHVRLEAIANRAAAKTEPGTALVLMDRQSEVDDLYEQMAGKSANRSKSVSSEGFYAGKKAGERADLGGSRVGSAAAKQIG